MNIYFPGMLITFITASLHCIWLYLYLVVLGCNIKGIGYSMGVTNFLNFLFISLYIDSNKPNPESYIYFDRNSVSFNRIFDYLKLAVPSGIIFSADWLGFHVLILYSSYLDATCLTVNVSLFNFYTLLFSIPAGISIATCMYVGNMTGSNKVENSKIYVICATFCGILCILLLGILIVMFKREVPYIYTDDNNIAELFTSLIPTVVLFGVIDAMQLILNGVLKGLGKQKSASFLAVIVLYPINVPMSLTLTFTLNYRLIGLWYSQLTAVLFLDFSYMIMILCLDWDNNAQRVIVNINNVSQKFTKKTLKLEGLFTNCKNIPLIEKIN
jgi:MATE family multidrug resistance protein